MPADRTSQPMGDQTTYVGPPGLHVFYANDKGETETVRFDDKGEFTAKRDDHHDAVRRAQEAGESITVKGAKS